MTVEDETKSAGPSDGRHAEGESAGSPQDGGTRCQGVKQLPTNPFQPRNQAGDEDEPFCATHPKIGQEDAMFCRDCKVTACPMFACLKGTHAAHDILPVSELEGSVAEQRQGVQNAVENVESTLVATLAQATTAIDGRMTHALQRIQSCRESIKAVAADRISCINAILESELRRIDEYEKSCQTTCQERKTELDEHLQTASEAVNRAKALLSDGNAVDVLTHSPAVIERLNDLSDRPVQTRPISLGRITYYNEDDEDDDDDNEQDEKGKTPDAMTRIRKLLGVVSIVSLGASFSRSNINKDKDGSVMAVSGREYSMTITTMTAEGRRYSEGDQTVNATWESVSGSGDKQPLDATVTDHNDGTYSVRYTLPKDGRYRMRVRINSDEIQDSPFDFVAQSDTWVLDPDNCSQGVILENEGRKVMKKTLGHSSVTGQAGWTTGKHEWHIKLAEKQNCYAGVSVRSPEAMGWKGAKQDPSVWCFSTNGYMYSNIGVQSAKLGDKGSVVLISLDCDNHTLKMKNIDSGVEEEITGLPENERLYPWFHLYYMNSFFELVEPETSPEPLPAPSLVVECVE